MPKVYSYLFLVIIAFIILKASTFGWRLFRLSPLGPMKKDTKLAEVLESHVFHLAQKIGNRSIFEYEKLEQAAQYITQQFTSFGYAVEYQEYLVYDKKTKNIIATRIGAAKPKEAIIVGAHYDTCFNPGADDNASAISGLLELARFFSDKPTNRTIKFIAFVNEEPPFFKSEDMGSRVYAKAARKRKENIKAVIILEMIGYYKNTLNSQRYPPFLGFFYPNRANFICAVSNLPSRKLLKEVVVNFKKQTEFPIESVIAFALTPGTDFSDHWSFWKEGYPAIMITDTAFYRNPHYHSDSDTYEKLDYKSMAQVVKGLKGVLIEISK